MASAASLAVLFKADASELNDAAEKSKSAIGSLGEKFSALKVPAAAGMAAIGAAGLAAGTALLGVGATFGDAMDGMRTATGKTGAELDALGASMKTVAAGVPNSIAEVSSVMGELSSRTGQTGADLEALTTQVLQMARVTGGDAQASVESLTRMLGDASVPTEKQAAALDTVFKASQQTGVGVDRLSQLMVQFGAPMRNLGMTMEESTALLGRFEKEGVNTELVMGALKAASAKWAKEGMAPAEGLKQTIAKIQELGPSAEATALAMETFGQKAGGDMVDTILGGKFAIDDLVKSIAGSEETIATANDATTGFAEKWEQTKNQLLVAIEPIATGFLEMAEGAGGALLDKLLPAIENLGYAFSDLMDGDIVAVLNDLGFSMETAEKFGAPLSDLLQEISDVFADSGGGAGGIVGVIDLLLEKLGIIQAGDFGKYITMISDAFTSIDWAGIGATIGTLAGSFMGGLGVVLPIIASIFTDILWPALQPVFTFIMDHIEVIAGLAAAFFMLTNPIGLVVGAIMAISALGPMIGKFFDDLGLWLSNLGVTIGTALAGAAGWFAGIPAALLSVLSGLGASAGGAVASGLSAIGGFFEAGWAAFLVLVQAGQDAITDWLMSIWEAIPADIRADLELIAAALSEKFQEYYDYIVAKMTEISTAISDAWTAIKDTITERIEAARVMISAKWDAIKEYLDAKLQQISAAIAVIWQGISDKIAEVMQWIRDKINEAWDWIFGKIDGVLVDIQGVVGRALDWIENATGVKMDAVRAVFDGAMTFIRGLISAALDFITGDWDAGFEKLKQLGEAGWSAIKNIFSDAWEGLKRIINWDELKAKFEAGKAALMAAGKQIVEGLKQGISDAWESLKTWFGEKIRGLLGDIKGLLGIKSPSSVFAEEVGEPIAEGMIQGIRRTLEANPMTEIIGGWASKAISQAPQLITPMISAAIGGALAAGLILAVQTGGMAGAVGKALSFGGNLGGLDSILRDVDASPFNRTGRVGIQTTLGQGGGSDGQVRADAFRSGRGGQLAASKSNYWKVFVSKWGVPTEASARKVAQQLGIPLPQWLEDIYNPKGSDSYVDPMAPMKEALQPAEEVVTSLKDVAAGIAAAGADLRSAIVEIPVKELENLVGRLLPPLDNLIPRMADLVKGIGGIVAPSPGGPPTIPPPGGGTSVFGVGGAGGVGGVGIADATINAQAVHLSGPVQVGFNGTFQVGSGRTLAVELVDALVADTSTFDKLIEAEDRRRAQKP